jgi:hypothetical protein
MVVYSVREIHWRWQREDMQEQQKLGVRDMELKTKTAEVRKCENNVHI